MGKRLFYWTLAGFLWTGIAGTVLHFFYGWTGEAPWAAAFSAVNESVWEHMKLLYIPVFLFSMVQLCALGRQYPNLLAVRAVTAALGTLAVPMLYYTYTGALGVERLWADVLIFFLANAGLFCLDRRLLRRGTFAAGWAQIAGLIALWGILFAFVWCSYRPPALPIFIS